MVELTIAGVTRKIPSRARNKKLYYYFYQQTHNKSMWDWAAMHGLGGFRQHILGLIHGCCIPRTLLIDPTYSCNLSCLGCYAAGYGHDEGLSYQELESIISQAQKLGIYLFLFTGGEPMVRKDDLIRLAERFPWSIFHAFTNGTLIDEAYADRVAKLGNLTFGFSVEGFREETDFRRGAGTYDKVMHAMDLLRERDIPFSFSACYHSKNYEVVTSDAFIKHMVEKGCWAGWYFTYMPIGKDASMELVCNPEQRASVSRRTRQIREEDHLNVVDFSNDGHLVGGCVAAGRQYAHINSRGDVEPCAFCHYSDSNIRSKTLLESLKSPFFTAFRKGQPFNDNPLRPCPILDNPEKILHAVNSTGAYSTEMCAVESVEELTAKTLPISENWAKPGDELYREMPDEERELAAKKLDYYRSFNR